MECLIVARHHRGRGLIGGRDTAVDAAVIMVAIGLDQAILQVDHPVIQLTDDFVVAVDFGAVFGAARGHRQQALAVEAEGILIRVLDAAVHAVLG